MSLPALLKLLTVRAALTLPQAMAAARVLVPAGHATAARLAQLGTDDLVALGVNEPEARRIAGAFGKTAAGGRAKGAKGKRKAADGAPEQAASTAAAPGAAADGPATSAQSPPVKKRRKAQRDMFEIADEAGEQAAGLSGAAAGGQMEKDHPALDLGTSLTEEDIVSAGEVRINRAPVMTAWATVVCLRLGFDEREALSLAHAFTDMNATAKAVSLGIKPSTAGARAREDEALLSGREGEGWNQPHVLLMGRKPVMTLPPPPSDDPDAPTPPSTYRALSSSSPKSPNTSASVPPSLAARYLRSSFADDLPRVLRAMTLVAGSFAPDALQGRDGWGLYCRMRPDTEGWGKKGVLDLSAVLGLREGSAAGVSAPAVARVKQEPPTVDDADDGAEYWDGFDFDADDVKLEPPQAELTLKVEQD